MSKSLTTDTLPWTASFWALVLVTLWLSLVPVNQLPSALHFWDKAEHALGFAALAVLGLQAYRQHGRRVILGLMVLGIAIECLQELTGWRQGDWVDWVADCVGIAIGRTVHTWACRWVRRRR